MRSWRPVRVRWLGGVAVVALAISLAAQAPATKASADLERRIEALLARMTLEEKLGQLQQLDGEADGRYRPEHLDLARKGLLGSTLNVRGAAQVNASAACGGRRVAAEDPAHLRLRRHSRLPDDLPDPARRSGQLGSGGGRTIGGHRRGGGAGRGRPLDVRAHGGHRARRALGPDRRGRRRRSVSRRCVRARARARLSRAAITASPIGSSRARSTGSRMAPPKRVATTTQSTCRSARSARSTFPPFRAAVDAGVGTVMSAFNDLNGVPASGNPFTLTQVLRKRMGVRRDRRLRLPIGRRAHQSRCRGRRGGCGAPGTRRRRRHGDGQPVIRNAWRPARRRGHAAAGGHRRGRPARAARSSFARACSTARTPIQPGSARRSCGPSSGLPRARLPRARWCCSRTTAACCRWRRPRERSPSSARSPTTAPSMMGNWAGDGRDAETS